MLESIQGRAVQPGKIALSCSDIAPIPGTKRAARIEENAAADDVELTESHLERLDNLSAAAGARHDENNMSTIEI